ncbi:MAG: transcriptional regulator [Pseudanabaena sp.]|nr:MAG: transcriptional regulator [Pseudanabaena sp.]
MKILLVSPDPSLRSTLHRILSRHSLIVDGATDGEDAWELTQAYVYDAILLEAALPKLDGINFCRRLRDVGNPVLSLLIVESPGSDTCIQGLENGADAWLSKPVQEPELMAQLLALSRRGARRASPVLVWGPLQLAPTARQVTCQGQVLKLNRKEYQLLNLFLNHPRQMFSHSEIGDRLWALDEQLPTDATIKSHIRSIRRKLEQVSTQNLIQTHYGQGYCLNPVYDPGPKLPKTVPPTSELMMDSITANIWQELMTANFLLQQELEQRRQVEIKLRRSEMMLSSAQRVAQIGCWEVDLQSQQIYWTDELFLIHGLAPNRPAPSPEEVLTLIHPDDLQIHEKLIRTPALRGEAFEANLRIVRVNDGEIRYINARGGPILDNLGKMIKLTGTIFDVTQWIVDGSLPLGKSKVI